MTSLQLSIILPTYNERGNIIQLIRSISDHCRKNLINYEIIVVDDDSPDNTGMLVEQRFKSRRNINAIIRRNQKGLATAILTGINKSKGKYILVMDTDFNHDPKVIPIMYNLIKRYDFVIGSRYIPSGGMENRLRWHFSRLFNIYIKLILKHGINDNLSGFFIIKRQILTKLHLTKIFYGFGDYFIRLIYLVYKNNYTVTETPVFYKNRTYGVSKSRFFRMFVNYTLTVLKVPSLYEK